MIRKILLMSYLILGLSSASAATSENFDAEAVNVSGLATKAYGSFTFTGDGSANISITNINSSIASGADHAVVFDALDVADQNNASFSTTDGTEFALTSLEIDSGLGDATITITGKKDGVTVYTANIDLSTNSSNGGAAYLGTWFGTITFSGWDNLDEVLFTGTSIDLDIDDIVVGPAIIPNTAPTLGGTFTTAGTVNDNGTTTPFSGVTVADADGDNVSVTITYTAANGTLTGTGITGSAGSYTMTSASPATVQTNLQGLTFTPTTNQVVPASTVVTTFTLTPNDGTINGTANSTTQITATSINDTPTDIALSSINVNQSSGANAVVGTLSNTDADTGQSYIYSLVAGSGDTNNASFNISGTDFRANDASLLSAGSYAIRLNVYDGITNFEKAFTITVIDDLVPTLSSISPTDNAIGIALDSNLVITLNENVVIGTGDILIKTTSGDTLIETIPVGDAKVTVSNGAVTINPITTLSLSTEYYVIIPATAFDDAAANSYAGLTATTDWSFTTVSDTIAPTISSISIPNTAMKIGDTVTATITVTSDTDDYTTGSGAITGTIDGFTLGSLSKTNDTTYAATFTVTDGGTDVASGSDIPVSVKLTDSTGNQMATAYTTSISQASDSVDANIPTLITVTASSNNADTTKSKVGDVITLTIVSSEALSANPVVTIAGNAATESSTDSTHYTATYTMQSSDTEGVVPFAIDFSDAAANAGTQVTGVTSGSLVTFDKTAPSGYGALITTDPLNNANKSAAAFAFTGAEVGSTYSYSIDDTNVATSAVTGTGSIATATDAISGINLSSLDDDTLTLTVALTDLTGNTGADATDIVVKDATLPTLSTVTMASNNADTTKSKVGDVITLTIVSSEALSANPVVTIAGNAATESSTDSTHYTATYTMQSSDTEGVVPFAIDFSDAATNTGTQVTSVTSGSGVTFDKTAPTLSTLSPADNATTMGTTSNLVITLNENVLKASGDILIKTTTGDTLIETIPVGDGRVTISNAAVTINPTATLSLNTEYYVIIPATAFKDGAGNSYAGLTATTDWSFTTVSNSAPTIAGAVTGQTVNDNSFLTPFSGIILADAESDNISVTITLDDNAKGTLSSTTIASGTLASVQASLRAIIFTPTSNRVAVGNSETTTFSIVANDGISDSATNSATTVVSTSINDAPTIDTVFANISILEDSNVTNYDINVSDVEGEDINITVESNNTNILTVTPNWSGWINQATWANPLDFNLTTKANANGLVRITVTTDDGDKNSTSSFDVNVTAVDDAPVLDLISDITTTEDFNDLNITLNANDAEGDTINYIVTSSDTSIATVSIINSKIVVTPMENASGSIAVEVNATANGQSVIQSFNITLSSVNDMPSIDTVFENISIAQNSGAKNYELNVSDLDGDDLNVTVESNNTNILTVTPNWSGWINQATWANPLDFNLTTQNDTVGLVKITITVDDGDVNTSKIFDLNVTAVNKMPTVESIGDIIVYKNFSDKEIPIVATNVDSNTTVYTASLVDDTLADITITNNILTLSSIDSKSGKTDINVTVSNGEFSSSTIFNLYVLPLEDGDDLEEVGNITVVSDENSSTTTLVIDSNLSVEAAMKTNGSSEHKIVVAGKTIKANSDINGTVVSFISNGVHTTYSDANISLEVNASVTGQAVHSLSVNGKTTQAICQRVGATTIIDKDENGEVEIVTSVTLDNNASVYVKAKADGTAEHTVQVSGGKTSKATSNINGAITLIRSDGEVETAAGEYDNGDGYIIKAVVVTKPNGESVTRFIKVNKTDPNDIELYSRTLRESTPYAPGNNVDLTEIGGKIYIQTTTTLDTDLIVD